MASSLVLWLVVVVLSACGSRTTEQPAVFSKELLISCCLFPEYPALESDLLVPSFLNPDGSSWQRLLSDRRCSLGLSYPSPCPCGIHIKVCGTSDGQKKLDRVYSQK